MSNSGAFYNNAQTRQMYIERVLACQLANEIVQGTSWKNEPAGAVGSTLGSNQHGRYEEELGIPRSLAYLEDRLFEGLPSKEARAFPFSFLTAVSVGADLSRVLARFMVWLLIDPEKGVLRFVGKHGQAVTTVAALYQRIVDGETVSTQEWLSALNAASTLGQAAVTAADAFTTASAFAVAAAANSASLAYHATVAAAAAAYVTYGTGEIDSAAVSTIAATVTTLGYGNITAVATDYGDSAAFMAVYGDDLAAFAGLAADRSAAACDPANERSLSRKAHYLAMRDRLLVLLREAPVGEDTHAPELSDQVQS